MTAIRGRGASGSSRERGTTPTPVQEDDGASPTGASVGLRLVNVSKDYAGQAGAVRSVTLDVNHGEFFVLLGPSGCGKSTLLKLIAGLEEPTSGEIYVGERLVNYAEPETRGAAMVFQNYALYPQMTVEQNVAFPLKMRKIRGAARAEAVTQAMRVVGIDELWRRRPVTQLSGGQRQRVAVARALVSRPLLTLMDEPLSNLDALLRLQTREQLLAMHRDVEGTIIYVTHDQVEAMTMGDRIGILQEGRLVQVGAPLDVYRNPANTFVAGFLGAPPMNFLAAVAADRADVAFSDDLPVLGALSLTRPLEAGEAVQVGLRPEAFVVEGAPRGSGGGWVIDFVEELGSERILALQATDKSTRVRARLTDERTWRSGERVKLDIGGRATIFDADGANISVPAERRSFVEHHADR